MTRSIFQTHRGEIARALHTHAYERADTGILIPSMGVFIGGAIQSTVHAGDELVERQISPNLLTHEGLNHVLNAVLVPTGGYAPITQWYIAPFSGNYTPDPSVKAATFPQAATEFTAYTAGQRPALTVNAAATAQSTGNTGAEAQFVMNAGGPYNIRGYAVLSSANKSATTGKALAVIALEHPHLNLMGGYKVGAEYVLTAADAA